MLVDYDIGHQSKTKLPPGSFASDLESNHDEDNNNEDIVVPDDDNWRFDNHFWVRIHVGCAMTCIYSNRGPEASGSQKRIF